MDPAELYVCDQTQSREEECGCGVGGSSYCKWL